MYVQALNSALDST